MKSFCDTCERYFHVLRNICSDCQWKNKEIEEADLLEALEMMQPIFQKEYEIFKKEAE